MTDQDWTPVIFKKPVKTTQVKARPAQTTTITKVEKIYDPNDPEAEPEIKPVMIGKEFGTLIQQHRTAKGMTQKQLAQALNLSVQVINDYERGTGTRNAQYVSKIKKYFGITKHNK